MSHPFAQWENALSRMSEVNEDMKELVSKWKEMLNTTPSCVEFHFFDGTMYSIPNFALMQQRMTLASVNATPDTLVVRDEDGDIHVGGVILDDGTGCDPAGSYTAEGISGTGWSITTTALQTNNTYIKPYTIELGSVFRALDPTLANIVKLTTAIDNSPPPPPQPDSQGGWNDIQIGDVIIRPRYFNNTNPYVSTVYIVVPSPNPARTFAVASILHKQNGASARYQVICTHSVLLLIDNPPNTAVLGSSKEYIASNINSLIDLDFIDHVVKQEYDSTNTEVTVTVRDNAVLHLLCLSAEEP